MSTASSQRGKLQDVVSDTGSDVELVDRRLPEEPVGSTLETRFCYINDSPKNEEKQYRDNVVITSKYTAYSFVPKNLFEQFKRVANIYFAIISILQLSTNLSPTSQYTTVVPLAIVLAVTMVKEAFEDFKRHKADKEMNSRPILVLDTSEERAKWVEKMWSEVIVGDIVRVREGEEIPSDIIILSSSESQGECYIETANLDGETNLKIKQGVDFTAAASDTVDLANLKGHIEYELPNRKLYNFDGTLHLSGRPKCPLDAKNILLRGSMLRNTEFVNGLVIFTGQDTKLMMNTKKTPSKRSNIEKIVNKLVFIVFALLALMNTVMAILFDVWGTNNQQAWYLPFMQHFSAADSALSWLTFLILFNNLVPISLYVTLELVKYWQAKLMDSDLAMFHDETDTPCLCRTSNLNEDLGQIEYVFSDKTGTLTRNEMEFRKCSINGKAYGFGTTEIGEAAMKAAQKEGKQAFDDWEEDMSHLSDPVKAQYEHDPKIHFDDPRLLQRLTASALTDDESKDKKLINEFLTLLAVCHTVIPEMKDGELVYQAASPDEGALVSAARCLGYKFLKQLPGNKIEVVVMGEPQVFEILGVNEFNSTRKRMSVVCRAPDGSVLLYCKGADNVIFDRLKRDMPSGEKQTLTKHLERFGSEGLRTLVLAKKHLSEEEYKAWKSKYDNAATSLDNREDKLMAIAEEIEQGLTLVGATAIEDKLQIGVPDAIANLARGGLKIWVLTGDKQETAINIGYACKLLEDSMTKMIINEDDPALAEKMIKSHLARLVEHSGKTLEHLALVIDGPTLTRISEEDEKRRGQEGVELIKPQLLELAKMCRAVVACRVSPSQKAEIVSLVRKGVAPEPLTLSIGDGANDVTMIQTAHVGIGISGNEGMQAVNNSDYAIAQFRFLEHLLLVHGRNNYKRVGKVINYMFYKNIMNTLVLFLFCFYNGFSGSSLYESLISAAYNVVWTSLPVIVVGILDRDVSPKHVLRNPLLYKVGQWKLDFNMRLFVRWLANAVIHALVIFLVCTYIFNDSVIDSNMESNGLYIFGTMTYACVVMAVNYKIAIETHAFHLPAHLVTWGSILIFFLAIIVYSTLPLAGGFFWIGVELFELSGFWLTIILVPCTAILLDVVWHYIVRTYRPDPQTIVREIAVSKLYKKLAEGKQPDEEEDVGSLPVRVPSSANSVSSASPNINNEIDGKRTTIEKNLGFDFSYPEKAVQGCRLQSCCCKRSVPCQDQSSEYCVCPKKVY